MDPITHTLTGAALSRAGYHRATPLATATLILAANAPDIDILTGFGGDYATVAHRRGWTHGPLALMLLPFAVMGLMLAYDRWVRRRHDPGAPPANAPALFLLALLGTATHPLLDWMNTYGIRLLMPFRREWYYGDALFIVDPWVWLMLGGGVYLAGVLGRRGRRRGTGEIALSGADSGRGDGGAMRGVNNAVRGGSAAAGNEAGGGTSEVGVTRSGVGVAQSGDSAERSGVGSKYADDLAKKTRASTRLAELGWAVLALLTSLLVLGARVPLPTKVVWVLGILAIIALRILMGRQAPRIAERLARWGLGGAVAYITLMVLASGVAEREVRRTLLAAGFEPEQVMVAPEAANPFRSSILATMSASTTTSSPRVTSSPAQPPMASAAPPASPTASVLPGAYLRGSYRWLDRPRVRLDGELVSIPPLTPIAEAAAATLEAQRFLTWSRFPVFQVTEVEDGYLVRISDLRFEGGRDGGLGGLTVRVGGAEER